MESFYVTVPSTASSLFFENTQSHFRCLLPQPIELTGEWVVGLSEIHVPTAWDNIDGKTNTFKVHYESHGLQERGSYVVQIPGFSFVGKKWKPFTAVINHLYKQIPTHLKAYINFPIKMANDYFQTEIEMRGGYEVEFSGPLKQLLGLKEDNTFFRFPLSDEEFKVSHSGEALFLTIIFPKLADSQTLNIKIPPGLYSETEQIIFAMKEVLPIETKPKIGFQINRDGTLTIICEKGVSLEFPKTNHGLGSLLGFSEEQVMLTGVSKGKYNIDLKRGIFGLYIYSDLIEPQMVGDTFAPLLRVLPVAGEGKIDSNYVKIYSNPDFYKLNQTRFESIEIDIRTDSGERLKFRHGKTLVKLIFKKV